MWSMQLNALSTWIRSSSELIGRPSPYRNVVCLGLILDAQGQKMSKSKGNTVEPAQVLDRYGADAITRAVLLGRDEEPEVPLLRD